MSALVLHFGEGGSSALPSEVAWLSSASESLDIELPEVKVFVSPSSINRMRSVYTEALGDAVEVRPLYFSESELDASAILSMMSVSSSGSAPLYVQLVLVCPTPFLDSIGFLEAHHPFSRGCANWEKSILSVLFRTN